MTSGFGAFTTNAALVLQTWHPWLEAVSGLSILDVRGRVLLELVPPSSRDRLTELLADVLATGNTRILSSTFHQHLIRCAPVVASPYFDAMQQLVTVTRTTGENGTAGLLITIEDVTALREHDRRLAERLARGNQDDATIAEGVVSADWRVRNRSLQGLHGVNDEEVTQLLRSFESRHLDFNVLSSALQALVLAKRDVAEPLLRLLQDSDPNLRMHAAQALGLLNEKRAVPSLLDLLANDADPNVRFHAIDALGRLQAIDAIDPLVRIAQSDDFYLAFPAVEALARIDDPFVVPGLVALLQKELLRPAVVEALVTLGDEESVEPLVAGVNEGTLEPAAVAAALVQIHARYEEQDLSGLLIRDLARTAVTVAGVQHLCQAVKERREPRTALVRVAGWMGPAAIDALVGVLGDPEAGNEAMLALERIGSGAVTRVADRLSTGDRDVRVAAARLLGRLGDRRACAALQHALTEADREIRAAAASSLATLGDPSTLESLLPLLGDPDATVRQAAVAAVNSIGAEETTTRILSALTSPDGRTRESAVRIAGYFGQDECLPQLIAALSDEDEGVRRAAIEQLPLAPGGMAPLLHAASHDTPRNRAAAVHALKLVDQVDEIPLLAALGDEDPWVRYFAADALADHGRAHATERLAAAARTDPAPPVRIAALRSLGVLQAPVLAELAFKAVNAADDDIACAALSACATVAHPGVDELLRQALRGGRAALRTSAIEALGQRGTDAGLDLLIEAMHLPVDPALGAPSIAALQQIIECSRPGHQRAVLILLRIATEPEWSAAAIDALARLPRAVAIDRMTSAMSASEVPVRLVIVEALARFRCPDASALLVDSLSDPDAAVRAAAVVALGRTGSLAGTNALIQLQHADPDPAVRRRAARVVERFGWLSPAAEPKV